MSRAGEERGQGRAGRKEKPYTAANVAGLYRSGRGYAELLDAPTGNDQDEHGTMPIAEGREGG